LYATIQAQIPLCTYLVTESAKHIHVPNPVDRAELNSKFEDKAEAIKSSLCENPGSLIHSNESDTTAPSNIRHYFEAEDGLTASPTINFVATCADEGIVRTDRLARNSNIAKH
jgi:hypothetical protein